MRSNCNMADIFQRLVSESTGLKCKRQFEGLDTALYKNIQCTSTFLMSVISLC